MSLESITDSRLVCSRQAAAELQSGLFPSQFACQKVQPYDGCYYSVTSRDQAEAESII